MTEIGGIAGDRLRSFIERIERLQAEIDALNADKREVYAEAKGSGFDVKAMKIVIRRQAMDSGDRDERDVMVDLYERALGTPVATRAGAGNNVVGIPSHG